MGFAISGKGESVKYEPNVVPLCDVLLVLLIIFMIVTPLVSKDDVTVPTALNTISMPDNPEVVLVMKKDGKIEINHKAATKETLQTMLEEAFLAASDKRLYLKIDQDVEFGKLVELIEPIKDSGVQIVGIVTEKKTEKVG